jgi:hypothetical protein
MDSARVDEVVQHLREQGQVSTAAYRPIHGKLIHLLHDPRGGGNEGEYYFPFLNGQGQMQHDYHLAGHRFGMVEEDADTWRYVEGG